MGERFPRVQSHPDTHNIDGKRAGGITLS